MHREDFFNKMMRLALFAALMLVIWFLAKKVIYGRNCSACPVYGTCRGDFKCPGL
jgi:ribose/xylose/arabinose/galactoside ABC-type transport system permease subunit